MEKEQEKPREPAPEVHDDPRVVAHRCPFCHEPVRPDDEAWVACAQCLGRQHAACWDESGRCGACRHDQRLEAPTRAAQGTARPSSSRPVLAAVGLSILVALLGAFLLFLVPQGSSVVSGGPPRVIMAEPVHTVVEAPGPRVVEETPAPEVEVAPTPVEAAEPAIDGLKRLREQELARASASERERLLAAEDVDGRRFPAPRAAQPPFTWIPEDAATTGVARRLVREHRERALEREGEASSLVLLAHVNVYAGNPEQAVIDCDRALDLDPRHGPAWTVRGWARLTLGDLDGAELDLRRGERLSDDPTWAMIGLGRVYELRGERDEARSFYRAGLELGGERLVAPVDHTVDLRRRIERLEGR